MTDQDPNLFERDIETQIHGRYLVSPGRACGPRAPVLLGFHGYAETAEEELRRLQTIPGIDRWLVVCIQGLHQFYRRRTNEVVASWMTRQNREFAIADNLTYVSQVVRRIVEDFSPGETLVTTGFSQGVAMAYRAVLALDRPVAAVLACGGDVPPELQAEALRRTTEVLIGRGRRDEWYTIEKMGSDEVRLRIAGVPVTTLTYEASHEWTPEFSEACSRILESSIARNSTL